METITALTVQKRNPDRVNVYIDGEFALGLPQAVAAKLEVGQTVTPEELDSLKQHDLVDKAKRNATRLISYRPRSVAEVQRRLQRKGYDDPVVDRVVEQLQAAALLDDVAFARYWVEQRETFKPRGQFALRQELQQKGVSRDIITAVLSDLDEMAAARRAAEKKARRWGHLPEESFRMKLGRFLKRRGFDYETIRQVTNETWQAMSTDTSTN
jgi:regulatory protein